ncbi:hypothetical protein SAMN05216464_12218 [Mucilaginibacter pineti]|uniref:Uncharacterized protein n=1 Tax=Mucilaginibacter pineti TaxID=1391627 RepID=A0A1G7MLP4_9SPHI|nr:DUF5995 family protein [Mucilaginibacter pineti]SDF62653.1 hypothetical protein SAMN05216464_12218 [Mucilaginibacter pineti]
MEAVNIDEIINELESIIAEAITTGSRAGYFAALYHKVTCKVKEGIEGGEFEDARRMEQLDVMFANRYIKAYRDWQQQKPVSASWKLAFDIFSKPSKLILQHLLAGMNAHINLDLGVAVVEVSNKLNQPLSQVHKDFNAINTILSALTYEVINELNQVSPLLSLAGLHAQNNSILIQFALGNARDGAWCFAEDLAPRKNEDYLNAITKRDDDINKLGLGIINPVGLLHFTVWVIHLFETRNPAKVTGILNTYKKTYIKVN